MDNLYINCFNFDKCFMSLGQHSYREHGNRMMLIWLHGAELAQMSPAKELYKGLIATGNSKAAGTLWSHLFSNSVGVVSDDMHQT